MSTGKQRLTFISYSRADSVFALQLARELKSSGFHIWLDQLDIPTGSRWDDEVEKALLECDVFMVILTPHSIASNNVKDEIGYAIDSNKRIMPVLLQNATVPFRLRRFQYVDFTGKSYEEGIESAKLLLKNLVHEQVSAGEPASVGSETEGVRILPRRLVDQQKRPGQVYQMDWQPQASSRPQPAPTTPPVQAEKPKSQSSWITKTIPILMGLALLAMVCVFGVWFIWPTINGQGTNNNIISGITLPVITSTDSSLPTSIPTVPPATSPAPTARPVDTATFTFTPVPVSTATAQVDPVDFIIGYFNAVIYNREYSKGWSMLTTDYQVNKSKGWDNYVKFWDSVRSWEYSEVKVDYTSLPRVRVLITYTLYYYGSTAPSHLNGVHYCLVQASTPYTWQIDLRDNCP